MKYAAAGSGTVVGGATFKNTKGALQIEAVEVKHWGRRWPSNVARGYNGYVLRREGRALLFAGDTALTPRFAELRSRGPFEVAIMPIGAYRPWIRNHCSPEEAFEMANAARARFIVPVHHQTFRLSDEPLEEPSQRLTAAIEREPERLALGTSLAEVTTESVLLPGLIQTRQPE